MALYLTAMIVDHKLCRLGGNEAANLYVEELEKLGDDKAILRVCLWPQLQALSRCKDIDEFRTRYPESVIDLHQEVQDVLRTSPAATTIHTVDGEGTYEPCGST
jgi:hypothetical protein